MSEATSLSETVVTCRGQARKVMQEGNPMATWWQHVQGRRRERVDPRAWLGASSSRHAKRVMSEPGGQHRRRTGRQSREEQGAPRKEGRLHRDREHASGTSG
eukprot:4318118-Pleurochrysis_carterae.AAC.1